MSSTLAPTSATDAERPTKPRLRGRRRALTVAGLLLALVGGAIGESGTAIAQAPPGSCTQWCNNPPAGSGVSRADWNAAVEAADFWANHAIDFNQVDYSYGHSYYHLYWHPNRGWPHAGFGNQWFGYRDRYTGHTEFVYYGGTFHDRSGDLAWQEQNAQHVSASQAYSTDRTHTSPYVEYDIDYHGSARSSRNARRIVRNSITGNVYVTYDHYATFMYLGHY
ncbi:ribonuclease domain-containing protein [Streptomyces sp. NPDC050704]|uniref:ribonuclease domain-containing protein n=1 Tax=Streptomyces sp. NPDC050704 TaxID=3157219 RepID=UPI00343BFC0E